MYCIYTTKRDKRMASICYAEPVLFWQHLDQRFSFDNIRYKSKAETY